MDKSLSEVAEILAAKLPEFTINIAGASKSGAPEPFNVNMPAKVYVILPEENVALRHTLMRVLNARLKGTVLASAGSESWKPTAACLDAGHMNGRLPIALSRAIQQGKFDGLTIASLEEAATSEERNFAQRQYDRLRGRLTAELA